MSLPQGVSRTISSGDPHQGKRRVVKYYGRLAAKKAAPDVYLAEFTAQSRPFQKQNRRAKAAAFGRPHRSGARANRPGPDSRLVPQRVPTRVHAVPGAIPQANEGDPTRLFQKIMLQNYKRHAAKIKIVGRL